MLNILKRAIKVPINKKKTKNILLVPSVQVSKNLPHGFISEERKFSMNHHQGQRMSIFSHQKSTQLLKNKSLQPNKRSYHLFYNHIL